ncbi:TPA: ATP-binding protein [Neisseria meningitidis]|uniref:ATP-binding protein n=1 Tax=Neisseria meningitidis TaxID=487 RepID=UPI000317CE6A|nr:ATP-binding protein [Neisseria meningitidis]EOC30952.1 his Kinase A domain protein [Neisseria meningitidis 2001001]EOC51963.1 his Kinase A domain protein [Neisseria meningitidis 2003051]MDA3728374.1 ATP-binding protein [Neisseria meningitidis]RPC99559.1 two-component sensor histidine kinase [Neisseria meningitidis]RQJ62946.1 two-component sensor histidine kinase [Neisseria meningitidis]
MFVPLAMLAGMFSYYETFHETEALQDDLLRQAALYVAPDSKPETLPEGDGDTRIFVQMPQQEDSVVSLSAHFADGLHTLQADDDDDYYRVYIRTTEQGRIAVMQENEYREDLAAAAARQSVLPLMILLTVWITHKAMRPVRKLSQSLEQRRINGLSALSEDNIPSEIRGFVTAINLLLKRADEDIRHRQRFVADAAHELRTPMTALSLQAERLNNMPLPPEAARQSAVLQQSIRRNKHLLEQLLALARSQSDETPLTKTTFGLQSRFRQVLQELMPLALEKRQDIGVAVGGDVEVSADETEIYTLIKTFADNAVRYTPPEGRIDLGFTDEGKYLAVWVEDNGNGIPESERARVLDPFYRILGTEQQGTGLGLSIADTLATEYGRYLELSDSRRFGRGLLIRALLDKESLK